MEMSTFNIQIDRDLEEHINKLCQVWRMSKTGFGTIALNRLVNELSNEIPIWDKEESNEQSNEQS